MMQHRYVMAMDEGMSVCGIDTFTLNGQDLLGEPGLGDDGLRASVEVSWISGIEAVPAHATGRGRRRSAVVPRRL